MSSPGEPLHEEIRERLSGPRLTRYEQAAGDVDAAVELYLWNARIGAAFFESLHLLEVGLRNAMHDRLQAWVSATSPAQGQVPWYRDQYVRLTPRSRDRVREARMRATVNGRVELPGRVVAELSFGFWWSLLADHYDHILWAPCLRHAFTNVRRRRLHAELDTVIKFRNRIAHHEPVYDRNLNDDWRRLLDISTRLSPRFAAWIDDSSRVPQVLTERP